MPLVPLDTSVSALQKNDSSLHPSNHSPELSELRLFERPIFTDSRGSFAELWRESESLAAGLPIFLQDNVAWSHRGVVRGLHFQNPRAQAKLVTVVVGEVFDIALDVRVGSPTFGRWASYRLSEANALQLYIPVGFAHAYQTLSEVSVVIYKCSDVYSPDDEHTIRWDDNDLAIDWPMPDAIVSPRDAAAPCLRELHRDRLPRVAP